MLKAYVEEKGYNIYGSKQIELPMPRYIVFYNGLDEKPDREELWLSDSFTKSAGGIGVQSNCAEY